MPNRDRIPPRLHIEIRIVCDMMLKTHYFDEAHWLWVAVGSPRYCFSPGAQDALRRAADVAGEFGFRDVAKWIRNNALLAGL